MRERKKKAAEVDEEIVAEEPEATAPDDADEPEVATSSAGAADGEELAAEADAGHEADEDAAETVDAADVDEDDSEDAGESDVSETEAADVPAEEGPDEAADEPSVDAGDEADPEVAEAADEPEQVEADEAAVEPSDDAGDEADPELAEATDEPEPVEAEEPHEVDEEPESSAAATEADDSDEDAATDADEPDEGPGESAEAEVTPDDEPDDEPNESASSAATTPDPVSTEAEPTDAEATDAEATDAIDTEPTDEAGLVDEAEPTEEAKPAEEAEAAQPSEPEDDDEPLVGRARLFDALSHFRRGQVAVAVLLCVLGYAAVVQVQTNTEDSTYAGLREQELIDILSGLAGTTQKAQEQIEDLESTRDELEDQTLQQQTALQRAEEQVDTLKVIAGTVPVSGPGITIEIEPGSDPLRLTALLDLIEELRTSGAEAMEIEGADGEAVRLVASSSIEVSQPDPGLDVGGELVSPPYRLHVIGPPDTLSGAIDFYQGPRDQLEDQGADVKVKSREKIDIESTHTVSH
ncbi:uncharacterized protein YlxW (UPF0749 family) [Nocardioides albertanoniae]|uniref:Uncharacterized protein YlxW (UPF0749 family) n=1 Tax=Nocardioides albertanoniae TaxID=1175486 RepID=A0A543A7V2_9ACTN|nr:DUF881 domain-containing protein [Nocardioides albertanoniae]TQL68668.1 uncharacterized protein YlxW (UPF0749 family) [Nocardioides albertanoniae]